MKNLYEKMINEAMGVQWADVNVLKEKRGTTFKVTDGQPYVDAVNKMTVADGQSKTVIDLHVQSVNSHYESMKAVTDYVRPEDDPFVEHYQTPVVLEILCEEDEKFCKSVDTFIAQIGKMNAMIGLESARRYAGFYGPTCVVDFAMIPGSTSNVVNQVLKKTDIPDDHKKTLLAAKSWGMNTSYGVGEVFAKSVEGGDTLAVAVEKEIAQLQLIYETPVEAQALLMDGLGMSSFDPRKFMAGYRKKMEPFVKAAIDDDVHYANIVTIPAYCVGDIAHHIAQSTYNMCKDDMVMAIIEAVTQVMDNSLRAAIPKFKHPGQVASLASGSGAAAAEWLLEMDGFNGPAVVEFLTRRFHNYVQLYPTRGAAIELHNCDFMDMIYRGWTLIDRARKIKAGTSDKLTPTVAGHAIDLDPIYSNDVINNPQRYVYPACAMTVRFAALMSLADFPCLLTSEPVTATLMTNIIALDKETPAAPVRACKNCASASLVDFRHQYCEYREAV
jgi:hypothetical protein